MSTPQQLQDLVVEILRAYPGAWFEFHPFPSGALVLEVRLNGRDFEIEYSPSRGTGVSENFENTPPFIGHDEAFTSLDDALARFRVLLADAAIHPAVERSALALHDKPFSS